MNWFTKRNISGSSTDRKQELLQQDGGCEHVEKDPSLAAYEYAENDSFGKVSSFVCCKECHEKREQEEGETTVVCHDCYLSKKKKDTIQWKWYDFMAKQGDEALTICSSCQQAEKHVQRVRNDEADRYEELGY